MMIIIYKDKQVGSVFRSLQVGVGCFSAARHKASGAQARRLRETASDVSEAPVPSKSRPRIAPATADTMRSCEASLVSVLAFGFAGCMMLIISHSKNVRCDVLDDGGRLITIPGLMLGGSCDGSRS